MARRTFFSFHFKADAWRTSQVRNIRAIEGNQAVSDNDWESIKKGGDAAIQKWIDDQMDGRSCAVVLIGSETAGRHWIDYEIKKAWGDRKGVVGVHIHNLKDQFQKQSSMGKNPFATFNVKGTDFASIARAYNPPYNDSKQVYDYISSNLENWVEEAIRIRANY